MHTKELTKCLRALANERRVRMVKLLLRTSRMRVGDIARLTKLSIKSTSKHLLKLAECDCVEREQVSLDVVYWLNRRHPLIRALYEYLKLP